VTARRIARSGDGAGTPAFVTFTFDGRAVQGVEGEPLAVALLAAGQPVISRSFRFHRPRGLMCSTGQCGWCECEVDGVPSVRSCRVPVHEGLVARGEHAWPSVEHDALSALGLFSRWIRPTFYHHRFLRPRRLRKRYLDVLRWFGGRGRLRVGTRPGDEAIGRRSRSLVTDVLVVGGGTAGLHAAIGAATAGASVIVLEADASTGDGELHGAAVAAGAQVLTCALAVGWYDGVVAAIDGTEHLEITAQAVVAATGSYDRVPLAPGADRPGVMAARTVIALIDRFGVSPGDRALLVGSGQELATAAELLTRAGVAELHGPVATASLVAVRGSTGVSGADVRIDGRRQHLGLDIVVFGDRSPNLDVVLAAGAAVEQRGDTVVPTLDANGRSTIGTLFVAGSAADRPIRDDASAGAARATGAAAARAALGRRVTVRQPAVAAAASEHPVATRPTSIAGGAMVCFCEDVRAWEIRAEQAAGYRDSELIKRRTGALTGPCQGKQCLQAFACLTRQTTSSGIEPPILPTARPPLRPIRLGDLVGSAHDDASERA
jgi:sarcosine oxidase, subunit alpha